jgi:hypothetical protein
MDFEQLKAQCLALAEVGDERAKVTLTLFSAWEDARRMHTHCLQELTKARAELAKKNIAEAKTPAGKTEGLASYMLWQIKRTIEHCEKFGILAEDAAGPAQLHAKVATQGAGGVTRHVATGEELAALPASHFRSPEEVAAAATRAANGMKAEPWDATRQEASRVAGRKTEGSGI